MRIAVISNFYPPYFFGGYEIQCSLHVEELKKRGHEVHILTSHYQEGGVKDDIHRHMRYINPADYSLNAPQFLSAEAQRRYIQLKRAVIARMNYYVARKFGVQIKPDVAFVWNMGAVEVTPVMALQSLNIPIVYNIGDYWLSNLRKELDLIHGWMRHYYRSFYTGIWNIHQLDTRYIQVNSPNLRRHYIAAGYPESSITVIPRGIRDEMIQNEATLPPPFHDRADKTVKLLCLGRVDEVKGVHIALEAMTYLREMDRNITLDIVGTGEVEYRHQLDNYVTQHQLEDKVHFLGKYDRQQVVENFPKYDISLLPALWPEPFGAVVIESMASGVPKIATNHGGPADTITNEKDGLLVPPGDAKAMADAIRRLIENRDLWVNIRKNGLQTVREQYGYDLVHERIEKYLVNVINENQSKGKFA